MSARRIRQPQAKSQMFLTFKCKTQHTGRHPACFSHSTLSSTCTKREEEVSQPQQDQSNGHGVILTSDEIREIVAEQQESRAQKAAMKVAKGKPGR
jgi:hypothetical protein